MTESKPMPCSTTELRVPFHDVDSMGIVWHGHYAKYFEVARCEFLDSFDYSYRAMKASGYSWPIIDMRVKYVKPIVFGQNIRVQCSLREWEYRLKLDYLITDAATGMRLTKGYTVQVAIDMVTEVMCFESPPILKQMLIQKFGEHIV
jgi:acyl-CoA thioester hydrolase